MGLFTKKNNDTKLTGRNIYEDKKNRTVYLSPITKKAYVLKPTHYDTFRRYGMRFVAPILAFLLISGVLFDKPIIDIPYSLAVSIVIAVAVYLFLAYKFYKKFLPSLTVLPSFEPTKRDSMLTKARKLDLTRSIIKTVLLVAISVLLILNGKEIYAKNQQIINLYLNYALAAGAAALALFQIYAIATRNQQS